MRHRGALLAGCLLAGLALGSSAEAAVPGKRPLASSASKKKSRRNTAAAAVPGAPIGGPRVSAADAAAGSYGETNTISVHVNPMGETVYSVQAAHFDVSPPLKEMAAKSSGKVEVENEGPRNPILPPWRQIRNPEPDPVVQPVPTGITRSSQDPFPLGAPSIGFNFLGVGIFTGSPSDSNGSVGNDQFVETVNSRYQVWSLDRVTKTATTLLGPSNINTLWSGFGGACQSQNSGDPIVLYDKTANRWLISQFTATPVSGVYFQCVALSQTADATGAYYRWAFAVPNNVFGDYPHFGTWSDAYYMMAHAFMSTSGGFVAALFAAMDRTKMLAGDPTATWQVISDPTEGGHMPADLDGFAPPPTGAPGIFLSIHGSSMFVYRMKVDWVTPANTVRTKQAAIPIAPATGACNGGGTCIPQPATSQLVASLGDRLMFRAAYRNAIDHESLVVSHSVDPSVSGLVSGVRWYEFRLSGAPNAGCSTYPCTYQQGTVADVAGGRSRWMPSIAMDGAENALVGYSATGTANGTDNHSIRYTGRGKTDPLGAMTVPETIIVTGTANNTNTRWGDYTSMSIDPADDCTFWYVSQYYTSSGNWSTRIASSSFPSGTGAGTCAPLACTSRPASAPAIGSATVLGDNQIRVTWTGLVPSPGSYAIERADGPCGGSAAYRPVASVSGATTQFTDTTVLGGLTYSYRVIAAADAGGRCQSPTPSACVQATATGTCNLAPSFAGATAAASAGGTNCGINVSWTAAATSCPLTPTVKYNVFRGTTPDFVPSAANRIASCVTGPSSYLDTANVASGTTYYYVVRAEDNSSGNGGECGGGNEEANTVVVPGTAYGPGTQAAPGTWTDGGGDGTAFLQLNVAGPGDTADASWRVVKTSADAGANHTPGGAYAYRNAGPGPSNTYVPNACAEMQTPSLTAGSPAVTLQYWERHQLEYHWDGIAVEYSVNGGAWNDVAPPSNDSGAGCAATDEIAGWEPMSCTQAPPINGCGYPTTKTVINGPQGGGTTCNDFATGGVTGYAHRCHPISGLAPSDAVRFRWRFASDPGAQFAGFYLDDVAVTNVRLPNACVPDTCGGQLNGTTCDDGNACTAGETCGGGTCLPGVPLPPPAEIAGLTVDGHTGTTLAWTAPGGSIVYDVVSSTLSDLRANGVATATCLDNDLGSPSVVDGRVDPAEGDGYYYLVRAQTPCASGTYGFSSAAVERVPAAGCP